MTARFANRSTVCSVLAATVLIVACSPPKQGVTQEPSSVRVSSPAVVGDLRLENFTSRTFGNTRSLRVLLPDGYDAPENRSRRYPVLYLADGQNLFDPATSVFGPSEWRVDETVRQLVADGRLSPLIVVGVDDAGRTARAHEYLPHPDTANATHDPAYDPAPQGMRYPDFLIGEVLPFIDARYRTQRGPAFTGIGGSSYGALISAYVVAQRPGVFGKALLESPTVGVYDSFILKDVASARTLPDRIYVGIGTNEDGRPGCDSSSDNPFPPRENPMLDGARRLAATLRAAGLDSSRLRFVTERCATHTHAAWARRLPSALVFLFPLSKP